jgi:hypothetical protein
MENNTNSSLKRPGSSKETIIIIIFKPLPLYQTSVIATDRILATVLTPQIP